MSHRARSSSPDAHARCSAVRPSGSDAEVTSKKPYRRIPRRRRAPAPSCSRGGFLAAARGTCARTSPVSSSPVPPEDEDEDGDEEASPPLQVAKHLQLKPKITIRSPSLSTRARIRGSASRTSRGRRSPRRDDRLARIIALLRVNATSREDASRSRGLWIDRRRHHDLRFSTVGEAFLVAAHAEVPAARAPRSRRTSRSSRGRHRRGRLAVTPDARDGLHPRPPDRESVAGDRDDDRVVGLLLRPSPPSRRAARGSTSRGPRRPRGSACSRRTRHPTSTPP